MSDPRYWYYPDLESYTMEELKLYEKEVNEEAIYLFKKHEEEQKVECSKYGYSKYGTKWWQPYCHATYKLSKLRDEYERRKNNYEDS